MNNLKKKTTILLALILAFFAILFLMQDNEKNLQKEARQKETKQNTQTITITQVQIMQNTLEEKRKTYGFPTAVFEELPKPPKDFEKIVELMHKGNYSNYVFFPKEFFLQPEFYPGFKENGFSYWQNPSLTHYAVSGHGFYPSIQEITIKKGQTKTIAFFLHAGWGVQSFQGTKIETKNTNNWIKIKIPEPEFLLGYSYPKFSNSWAKKIQAIISIDQNTPTGKYELEFFPTNPSQEKKQKWTTNLKRKYESIAGYGINLNTKITIKVTE